MCGKTATYNLKWAQVYAYASALIPPAALPPDPANRINISPSRLRRKAEPDSMVWETLPVIYRADHTDTATEALWPFIPAYAQGRLPTNRQGRIISTANARLRTEGRSRPSMAFAAPVHPAQWLPFAPTFMGAWSAGLRVLVVVSWFYEFDSRVKPQIPYAVFPTDAPFWLMAGLASRTVLPDGSRHLTVAVITVDPNAVLKSVGHHRSPALLRDGGEAHAWLHGNKEDALALLRPFGNETMGVEAVPMQIKIPGNENVELPGVLLRPGA
jgi:putative SOS response-associated peptidase YedK